MSTTSVSLNLSAGSEEMITSFSFGVFTVVLIKYVKPTLIRPTLDVSLSVEMTHGRHNARDCVVERLYYSDCLSVVMWVNFLRFSFDVSLIH